MYLVVQRVLYPVKCYPRSRKVNWKNILSATSHHSDLFIRLKTLNSLKHQHVRNFLKLYIVRYAAWVWVWVSVYICCMLFCLQNVLIHLLTHSHSTHRYIGQAERWRWHLDSSKQSYSCLTVVYECVFVWPKNVTLPAIGQWMVESLDYY